MVLLAIVAALLAFWGLLALTVLEAIRQASGV
jgi:hypothetical protein